jgi:hypothetical protein
VRLLSASDGQNLTEDTDEMTEGMVTIMAVFAQIEKKTSCKRTQGCARSKICSTGEAHYLETNPELVRRQTADSRQSKAAAFASRYFDQLAIMGYVNGKGKPFSAAQIQQLLVD